VRSGARSLPRDRGAVGSVLGRLQRRLDHREGGAAGTGPKYNAMFFFGIPQFSGCFVPMWEKIQQKTGANSYVAEMFPNDADGNAFRAAFGPTVGAMFPNKFTFVDGGAYTDLTASFTSMIETFKTGGPSGGQCDLFVNCPLPPDFQSFWTQASQQGYLPKLATVAKVMLFPTDAYALGALSNNIATDAWFTPYSPMSRRSPVSRPTRSARGSRCDQGSVGAVDGLNVLALRGSGRGAALGEEPAQPFGPR